MLHFDNVGLYDGLFVMQDQESKTLWNHITGEALYGPHVGRSLGPVGNLRQMNVSEALEFDPEIQVAISDRPYAGRVYAPGAGFLADDAELRGFFVETLGEEDERRPRMDMGLGIWTAGTQRYYPLDEIRARGGAFVDSVDGRPLVVFIDSSSATPTAFFTDAAVATASDGEVRLDTGAVIRAGLLYGADGERIEAELPQQIFTRWYGYALTFPAAEIYGE